ncbi:hypothetical protein OQA88_5426 [Cercophora sp. LCS_1]
MHLALILSLLAGATTAFSTNPLDQQDPAPSPPADEIQLASVVFAGSGCPAGSVSGNISPDPTKITLAYDYLTAQTGRNITAANSRKNCQLNIKLKHSAGWHFSVSKTSYRGHARIPAGTNGTARATYYFSGESGQATSTVIIPGPYDGEFLKTDEFSLGTIWSPCGNEGLLNINSEVRLTPTNSTQPAVLSVTSLEKVELSWQRCVRAAPSTATPSPTSAP